MERTSITLPTYVAAEVRKLARRRKTSVSALVTRALEQELLLENAARAIAEYEREHGEFTAIELQEVEARWATRSTRGR